MFNGSYPFIDVSTGGRVDGVIAAIDRALVLLKPDTKIISGHGPRASVDDEAWGRGFLKAEAWVGIVYDSMASNQASAP